MSLYFAGNATSYLTIPDATGVEFGTNNFTIEWWQYQTDTNNHPRVFQIGVYNTAVCGVSIEGGTFYYWTAPSGYRTSFLMGTYKNTWVHIAIVRSGTVVNGGGNLTAGTTTIYKNGVSMRSFTDLLNYQGSLALTIANELGRSDPSAFGGYIYNFGWTNGTAVYTTNNFTPPTNPLTPGGNTVLILDPPTFGGSLGGSVENNGVLSNPATPFSTPNPSNNGPISGGGDGGNDSALCYLEGTRILCFRENEPNYIPIEHIRAGDWVQTFRSGLKRVAKNGYLKLKYSQTNPQVGNRLYRYSKQQNPQLYDDLVITGYHSVLVQRFTDQQRQATRDLFDEIYITEGMARLAACLDDRAQLWDQEGEHRVYHLALENDNLFTNYGIYANGMLSETTSLRMFEEGGFEVISELSEYKDVKERIEKTRFLENGKSECEWI